MLAYYYYFRRIPNTGIVDLDLDLIKRGGSWQEDIDRVLVKMLVDATKHISVSNCLVPLIAMMNQILLLVANAYILKQLIKPLASSCVPIGCCFRVQIC